VIHTEEIRGNAVLIFEYLKLRDQLEDLSINGRVMSEWACGLNLSGSEKDQHNVKTTVNLHIYKTSCFYD
jgi:hypothetical protein